MIAARLAIIAVFLGSLVVGASTLPWYASLAISSMSAMFAWSMLASVEGEPVRRTLPPSKDVHVVESGCPSCKDLRERLDAVALASADETIRQSSGMSPVKVAEVAKAIALDLRARGAKPERMAAENPYRISDHGTLANHALWMSEQLVEMAAVGKSDGKLGRWLGWIQCAIWVLGMQSVGESKKQNMPEGEMYDRDH